MRSKVRPAASLAALALVILLVLSLVMQLELPQPTGPYAVGRTARHWVDLSRPEEQTDAPNDYRELPAQIWYPARSGTGGPAPYFPSLAQVASALAASGEVAPIEVFGLRFIRSRERLEAGVAGLTSTHPVVLLSPGNGTNVEFYAGLAGELASHGYVVVGLNHPFDVAAVALQAGGAAQFAAGPPQVELRQGWVADRIAVRTADVLFALEQLQTLNEESGGLFAGRLDLTQVGIMGHSLGGITAAEACRAASQLRACVNLDGLQQGGPFSVHANPALPSQPFMMITKEQSLHPAVTALFEALSPGSYRVVLAGAAHDNFTDGPLLLPALWPGPNQADRILSLTRAYTLAFFDQALRHQPSELLNTPGQSPFVQLEQYPSQ